MAYIVINTDKLEITGAPDSKSVMVADESELTYLQSYPAGTFAYTEGKSKIWEKREDGTWEELSTGGGGSETVWEITITNNSSKADQLNMVPAPYDDNNYYSLAYYIEYNGAFYVDFASLKVAAGATGVYKLHILTSLSELTVWANSGSISSVTGNATLDVEYATATVSGNCAVVIEN